MPKRLMTADPCPCVTCPLCEESFDRHDYFELKVGSVIECPKCAKEIEMTDEDVTRIWYWEPVK